MAYRYRKFSYEEALAHELRPMIAIELNRALERLERKYGSIHLTALDGKAYKRYTNGIIKILTRAMIRKQLIP